MSTPKLQLEQHPPLESVHADLYAIHNVNAFDWMKQQPLNSIHAVVTDPPYGLLEYTEKELAKMKNGRGGVWRIPPAFDGAKRRPLPRFTVLTRKDKVALRRFFMDLAESLFPILVPGAHVFIATNPLVAHLVYSPFIEIGFEPRGEIIRIVHRLRGGDRPKNAHHEFPNVSVLPKSCWEPWGLFRKSCEGRVQDNLRRWKTGGLRRISSEEPFKDLIQSSPTRGKEYELAPHPSLKPQHFLRRIVRAALPLGKGIILDPFMGSGSTIAAASALKLRSVGLEVSPEYFELAVHAIPSLSQLEVNEPRTPVYLTKNDWKYEGSKAGATGGGRTHTFSVKAVAKKLKSCAVYKRRDIVLAGGKPIPVNGD